MLVSLFGRPGAGKSTLGDFLASEFGFLHLPLGRLLQLPGVLEEIGVDRKKLIDAVQTGRTICDERLFDWIDKKILKSNKPVVVDGYPRTNNALVRFNELASAMSSERTIIALRIEASTQISAERVKARNRSDDHLVSYAARNREFQTVQEPLLHNLYEAVKIIKIDGDNTIEGIQTSVANLLNLSNGRCPTDNHAGTG